MHCFVDMLYIWWILEVPTIYPHFCFVLCLVQCLFQCLFCNFCFKKIFDGFFIVTCSHSYRSKFFFCNFLTSVLHSPCTKSSCLSWWFCLFHLLVMYVDSWFHVWHTTVANFHIDSVKDFRKPILWWKVCANQIWEKTPYVRSYIHTITRIKRNYVSFPLLFWVCC